MKIINKIKSRSNLSIVRQWLMIGLLIVGPIFSQAKAQGQIFGLVHRSDVSVPANGELTFLGFVAGTDNELHVFGAIGAGYDNGNWFDDFQNFINAPAGEVCRFDFFDTLTGEGGRLDTIVSLDGFQQSDITLAPASWPEPPTDLRLSRLEDGEVRLDWKADSLTKTHIFRRQRPSAGSFFRLDNPTGSLFGSGNSTGLYIDSTTLHTIGYDYLLLAVDAAGNFSPPVIQALALANCCGLFTEGFTGNTTGDDLGKRNLADITRIIDRVYLSKRPLWCELTGNTTGDEANSLNLADITRLIDLVFVTKVEAAPCQ